MKSKSILFLLTGIAIGAIAGVLLAPQKSIKRKKGGAKKINKTKKAFKETASKYKDKLSGMENETKPNAARASKGKSAINDKPGVTE